MVDRGMLMFSACFYFLFFLVFFFPDFFGFVFIVSDEKTARALENVMNKCVGFVLNVWPLRSQTGVIIIFA